MIFSELYSAYYNTVAKIVKQILNGSVDNETVHKIIQENAFEESVLNIVPAIRQERWQVVTKNYTTPIKHVPTMPLTTLQKRWLKAVSLDERIRLFDVNIDGLEDVEPLFTKDDYCVYDKYLDGDNFADEEYIQRFRLILYALHNKLPVKAEMANRNGKVVHTKFIPQKIEYSEKDDKFRVLTGNRGHITTVNIGRITSCSLYKGEFNGTPVVVKDKPATITMLVKDERNALERTMLHFAHFEKHVEKVGDKTYKVLIKYDSGDASEMVIRVLCFGPLVEVVEPADFREMIVNKLKKQQSCGLK